MDLASKQCLKKLCDDIFMTTKLKVITQPENCVLHQKTTNLEFECASSGRIHQECSLRSYLQMRCALLFLQTALLGYGDKRVNGTTKSVWYPEILQNSQ